MCIVLCIIILFVVRSVLVLYDPLKIYMNSFGLSADDATYHIKENYELSSFRDPARVLIIDNVTNKDGSVFDLKNYSNHFDSATQNRLSLVMSTIRSRTISLDTDFTSFGCFLCMKTSSEDNEYLIFLFEKATNLYYVIWTSY